MPSLIRVNQLEKEYRQGFWMRRVRAVKGISFEVEAGHIFGFLGPNGAGKTTTIKVLTGLIAATAGTATLFGTPSSEPRARRRLGFLPENPYVYPYLTPREFVQLSGRLSGLGRGACRDRTSSMLRRVGIEYAADRPVRRLSKGMLQRAGLAAALVADPELLILDEPMSGLDPVGRKEVRDLILEERAQGRTIFFSTHILSDVETLCDHVAILRQGEVVVQGALDQLLARDVQRVDLVVNDDSTELEQAMQARDYATHRVRDRLTIEVQGTQAASALLAELVGEGRQIVAMLPRNESLEDLFVREAIAEPKGKAGNSAPM